MEFDDYIILFSASISAFFSLRLICISEKENIFNTSIAYIYSLIIVISLVIYLKKPTAMDVYRNKTTLEITYKNRVPIDSTVVWKNK